jgi:hypothetical protein
MESHDPQGDLINFYDEDNSRESALWLNYLYLKK